MKKLFALLAVLAFLLLGGAFASADVMDFEDLTETGYPFTGPYQGFNFVGAGSYEKPAVDNGWYGWDGTNGNYSIYAYTFGGIDISTVDGSEFSLDSLFVTTDAENYTISIRGYRDNTQVAYTEILNAVHSQQYFVDFASLNASSEWDSIDRVWIGSGYGGANAHVCLDDITYNSGINPNPPDPPNPPVATPEPTTMLLLGLGLLGIVPLRKRLVK